MAVQKVYITLIENAINTGAEPRTTPVGAIMMPISINRLPVEYKESVLAENPFADDSEIIEAYLGYGPYNILNYKQWSRMMEYNATPQ